MANGLNPGAQFKVTCTGEEAYDSYYCRDLRKGVELLHVGEGCGSERISAQLLPALSTPPNRFPNLGDVLKMRPWDFGHGGVGVELMDESGNAWISVVPGEQLAPIFGQHGCEPYADEDWAEAITGMLPARKDTSTANESESAQT